ncbi:MAG: hypothetical protein Q7W30_04880 [Coriobacteriia bacterium]|nr:hypothetical protein [Coriobacteriia bacterium]
MLTALYIALGVLVAAGIAMQVWMARASGGPGVKSGTVVAIRVFNVAMLIVAAGLVVYAIAGR